MPSPNVQRDNFFNLIQQSYGNQSFRGDYDGDDNLIYAGFALPGAADDEPVWQIKQLNYDGSSNLESILWPLFNGKASTAFNFVWDDRASYTYE